MAAHPEDPVGDELDALLKQSEIRQRLDESQRRFEAGETRTIPNEEVRRRLGITDASSPEEPPSAAEG